MSTSPVQTATELRRSFLEFFGSNGHEIVQSAPIVPQNDPSLMFVNAGMVPFKDLFTGREQRSYKRATSSQKCIRISGKHNDLEAVGPSPRHHTFFEMLGNFSFGDYFKEQAILFAWEYLTKVLCLPKDRLIVTYFKGEDGIAADEEARELWRKISGFGDDRIRGLGKADNFWSMGDTGPCGPCSEIYFCHGDLVDPGRFELEQMPDGSGWLEIWNLVFMQFERSIVDGVGQLTALPAPSIDTGAGLERLSGVVQGKISNYDTDLLRSLVDKVAELSGKRYGASMAPDDVSMRVIADHARTTSFLLSEGILPDRTARPYVLRRVMRRAIRHGHRLGIARPFLHEVADVVIELMGGHYAELRERRDLILSVAEQEEVRFRQTIERGLSLLEDRFTAMAAAQSQTLDGEAAFQLYDTFGFPKDLTDVICRERGFSVDDAGYDAALDAARKRSEFKGMDQAVEQVYRQVASTLPAGQVRFVGYDTDVAKSSVLALISDGASVGQVTVGDDVEVVVGSTPFYGEAGGQVGDRGTIRNGDCVIAVHDTQRPVEGLWVHRGRVESGKLAVGEAVELAVDGASRQAVRRAHSATHLVHLALRTVLGGHALQKGSVVSPDRLRFDFTHGQAVTAEQLREIESIANDRVVRNAPVVTEVLSIEAARERGAMMIFEEKYGSEVRMLTMGDSMELCGGTHARSTGELGLVKIVSEQGVAAGVRRIVAVTGPAALALFWEKEQLLDRVGVAVKSTGPDLFEKVEKLVAQEKALHKEIDQLQRKLATGGGGLEAMLASAREVEGAKVLSVRSEVSDRGALRELAEQLRDRLGEAVVLIGSEADGKAQLVCCVSKGLQKRFPAGQIVKQASAVVGGSGGGRPDMAQAGGTDVAKLGDAVEAVYGIVAELAAKS